MIATFLSIIKDYIYGQQSTEQIVNVEELCRIARQHQLATIIYHQTKIPALQQDYYSAISSTTNNRKFADIIINSLRKNNIGSFLVKGPIIAQYYSTPALRTMGDIDIVTSDRERAAEVLFAHGYKCIAKYNNAEWEFEKDKSSIELHDSLVYKEEIITDSISDFLNDSWNYVVDGTLELSYHFIYVMLHLRKHLMKRGVGFRQFLDIAMMIKNCTELDWIWIEGKLKEIELLDFAKTVFALIESWWGVSAPIEQTKITDEFYHDATSLIWNNGVFGFENSANKDYKASNAVMYSKCRLLSRIKRILEHIFPGYSEMRNITSYAFINGRPYLLPVAWIYRFFIVILKGKTQKGVLKIESEFVPDEYVDKKIEMFNKWGL